MKVYITRINGADIRDKAQYIQTRTAEIAFQLGCKEMGVYRYNAAAEISETLHVRVDGIIAGISAGDIVVCQFPTWNGLRFERTLVEHIQAYHGHVVIFIHDFEALMENGWSSKLQETIRLYNCAESLIIPSYAMQVFLLENGIRNDMKFVVQEMWDYPSDMAFNHAPGLKREICYVGSPVKAAFPNQWSYDTVLKVFSDELYTGKNVQQMGWMNSGALLQELSKGGFGLVWYGDEASYQYMKYSNSVELSAYLAADIPIIVPRGISNQYIIEENHLGLIVDSLDEAVEKVQSMTEEKYQEHVRNVRKFGILIRDGYFTRKIIPESVQSVYRAKKGSSSVSIRNYYLEDCEFLAVKLSESYGGNLALSWNFKGKTDGFLIYDSNDVLIEETENTHKHYLLIKDCEKTVGFVIRAYVNTLKGRLIIAESEPVHLEAKPYKTQTPIVSLIMPAYNAEGYIARSIDTVLAQSFSDLEIIIVNDGSTDKTQEIINWYEKRYSGVRVFNQSNKGQASARNTGIKYACGEYLGFIDSDDMIRPDMVEKLYDSARKNNCDIAISSAYQLTNDGYKDIVNYPITENTDISVDDFFEHYMMNIYPVIWNKLYRTSLVKERPFALVTYEDDAWTPYILSYAEKVCYIDEKLYEYDRTIRDVTVIKISRGKPMEEKFIDHKEVIEFFLKNGNPQKRKILIQLALRLVGLWMQEFSFPRYGELRDEIEQYKRTLPE